MRKSDGVFYSIIGTIFLILVFFSFFGEKGIVRLRKMNQETEGLAARIAKLKQENRYLSEQLSLLETDRHYIEDIARRELGYVREGEIVYRFRE